MIFKKMKWPYWLLLRGLKMNYADLAMLSLTFLGLMALLMLNEPR
jgi:hypothetical protein